jgi:predicted HAD superfamily phosphohydrolase
MSEFNPMEELGFIHDKQLVCSSRGFLEMNNNARDLCERFISNGGKFYDMVTRYEDVIEYILNRDTGRSGNLMRLITPFLKAFGATDYGMFAYSRDTLRTMPESKRVVGYLMSTLPTFFTTTAYEHDVMCLCDALDIPRGIVDCTEIAMDTYEFSKQEARTMRDFVSEINSLRLPTREYEINVPTSLDMTEMAMVRTFDEILMKKMGDFESTKMMRNMKSVGTNDKALYLLDIRKRTQIDLDGTAYIGGDITDYQALDLVRDMSGLAMSFNGSDFAVRGCNIAVLSRDCTVAAVLVQSFYNEGIESVLELVENWDRESLSKMDFPDPYLMNAMLAANPKKLPEVYAVNRHNVDEIAKKSDKYRKNLLRTVSGTVTTKYGKA